MCKGKSVACLILLAGLLVGCGDTPQVKVQRARIYLSKHQPEQAIELVDAVLRTEPANTEALLVKARAQMQMVQLDSCWSTLVKLLEHDANSTDTREAMVSWVALRLSTTLYQTDFFTNTQLQQKFDAALAEGQKLADWFQSQKDDLARAEYLRARLAGSEAMRIQIMIDAQETQLTADDLLSTPTRAVEVTTTIDRLKGQMHRKQLEAESHYEQALRADPSQFDVMRRYAMLMEQRQAWPELWVLIQRAMALKDLTPELSSQLVVTLLGMPDQVQPRDRRLEACWTIQNAVSAAGKNTMTWKLASARLHLLQGQPKKAQLLLTEILGEYPRDYNARYLMARSYYDAGDYKRAKLALDQLSTDPIAVRSSEVHTLHGMTLMQLGEDTLAAEALRRATELKPDDLLPRQMLTRLLAHSGRGGAAERDVNTLYDQDPADPQNIRIKIQYELSRNQTDEVRKVLKNTTNIRDLTPAHLMVLVEGFNALKDYAEAERWARQLVAMRPEVMENHLLLAESLLNQNRDDQVRQVVADIRQRFPGNDNVDAVMGRLFLRRREFDRAVDALQRALVASPDNVESRLLLAQALVSLAQAQDALEQIELVLAQRPDDYRAHALAAHIYELIGDSDKAKQHLSKISETEAIQSEQPALLAQIKLSQNKLDEAAAICDHAIAEGNPDLVLRLLLAEIAMKRERPDEAEGYLVDLVRREPDSPFAYRTLARFYVKQKEVDTGLLKLQQFASTNEPLARLAQGWMLMAANRLDEALAKMAPAYIALVQDRKQSLALLAADTLANLFMAKGEPEKAAGVYQPMIKTRLGASQAALRVIDLTWAKDDVDTRLKKLDILASVLTPEERSLRLALIGRYRRLGRLDRAVKVVDDWIARQPDEISLYRMKGEFLVEQKHLDQAIEVFKLAITKDPQDVQLRQRLGVAYMLALDFPSAEATLKDMATLHKGARLSATLATSQMFTDLGLHRQAVAQLSELEKIDGRSDPRASFVAGRSFFAMRRHDEARKYLEAIPSYAPQYVTAQVLLARIEQSAGKVDQARKRLAVLNSDPRTRAAVASELASLNLRNADEQDLLKWSDEALKVEQLSPALKTHWLTLRVAIADRHGDWATALKSLEMIEKLRDDAGQTPAAHIAVLLRLGRVADARAVLAAAPSIRQSVFGPLLAAAMGEPVQPSDKPLALPQFIMAMSRGDVAAARASAEALRPRKTVYRTDLLAELDRPDASAADTAVVYAKLAAALVALESDLPGLCAAMCDDLISDHANLVLAHGLRMQALVALDKPIDPAAEQVRKHLPDSSLAMFLSAQLQAKAGDHQAAIGTMAKLLKREPNHPDALHQLAQFYRLAGDDAEAIATLKKLYELTGSGDPGVANELAYLMAMRQPNQLEQAFAIAGKAYDDVQSSGGGAMTPYLLDTLGWIQHLRGKDAEALDPLTRSVLALRDRPEVHFHLGMVYEALENRRWARYHLNEAAAGDKRIPEVDEARQRLLSWGN